MRIACMATPVEDRGGEGGVAEEAAPVAEPDIRGDGGEATPVPSIDEVAQGVSSGRLIATFGIRDDHEPHEPPIPSAAPTAPGSTVNVGAACPHGGRQAMSTGQARH